MELSIKGLPQHATQWDVTRAVAQVLHDPEFPWRYSDYEKRSENMKPTNFHVIVNPCEAGGARNDGTGVLQLPGITVGRRLIDWSRERGKIVIQGKKIRLYPMQAQANANDDDWRREDDDIDEEEFERQTLRKIGHLEKTPYIDPDIQEKRQRIIDDLSYRAVCIDKLQIGTFFRPLNSTPKASRSYSSEYEKSYKDRSLGWLRFEYQHKLIRAELGNRSTDHLGYHVVIKFSNVSKICIGHDFGNPFICFDLYHPPEFLEEDFTRALTGVSWIDKTGFRRRVSALDESHRQVAPYAYQLRLILSSSHDIEEFQRMCFIASLRKPIKAPLVIESKAFFQRTKARKQLDKIHVWLKTLPWSVAFQIEALLHNGLLNTDDLLQGIYGDIMELHKSHPGETNTILRFFMLALPSMQTDTPRQCLRNVKEKRLKLLAIRRSSLIPKDDEAPFMCHHATITPTKILLDGPYPNQSNRIIRQFRNFSDHFLRVDFRDEEGTHFKWSRDMDRQSFLEERVGQALKNGFELAGRQFEFLMYSNSALRGHQVWFMSPFKTMALEKRRDKDGYHVLGEDGSPITDSVYRNVNAEWIRSQLGKFEGQLVRQPSKYAARMAQAFTATDATGVFLERDHWEIIDDIETADKKYNYTDGCGTISQELADLIWAAMCKNRIDHGADVLPPSVYQIRFLGCKGVVSIDKNLSGIFMRLRRSMQKFEALDVHIAKAEIEIARAFERPGRSHLNRALIMVLEDLGVPFEAFKNLQDDAIAEAKTIHNSMEQFQRMLERYNFGNLFRLRHTVERLTKLGFDLKPESAPQSKVVDHPFLARVRQFAMTHILREVKHAARIPIHKGHLLVGVADEGPSYKARGHDNVYVLPAGMIFACIQGPEDKEPIYLKGRCIVSRSPVVHPGDVQRAFAIDINEIPEDQLCSFRDLRNVVVFSSDSSNNERPLPSQLGGGDLDGDLFDIIQEPSLIPNQTSKAGTYLSQGTLELPDDREDNCHIGDICDFVVEYINSDIVGLVADKHLVIADQSNDGVRDVKCIKLAEMHSQAVDYPKNGIPVDLGRLPRNYIPFTPDWKKTEIDSPRDNDYYRSTRALGELFRAIEIEDPFVQIPMPTALKVELGSLLSDNISQALMPIVNNLISSIADSGEHEIAAVFEDFSDELRYISCTHTLSDSGGTHLREEEIFIGAIVSYTTERRLRQNRTYNMREHAGVVVAEVKRFLIPIMEAPQLIDLKRSWKAWEFSLTHQDEFGANAFGMLALAAIFDCLDKIGALENQRPHESNEMNDAEDEDGFLKEKSKRKPKPKSKPRSRTAW